MTGQGEEKADPEALALSALAFLAEDDHRFDRFLRWTGLEVPALRASLEDRRMLAGILDYLLDHEALLIACAEAIGVEPAALGEAGAHLKQDQ